MRCDGVVYLMIQACKIKLGDFNGALIVVDFALVRMRVMLKHGFVKDRSVLSLVVLQINPCYCFFSG